MVEFLGWRKRCGAFFLLRSASEASERSHGRNLPPPKSTEFRLFEVPGPPSLSSFRIAHLRRVQGEKLAAEERKIGSFKTHRGVKSFSCCRKKRTKKTHSLGSTRRRSQPRRQSVRSRCCCCFRRRHPPRCCSRPSSCASPSRRRPCR